MAVSLIVREATVDIVDCWMCTTESKSVFKTTIEFEDESGLGNLCLCVEHMDAVVMAALQRHTAELLLKNPRWYEVPEDDAGELTEREEAWLERSMS